ncbi:MAG TPA: CHAT domain-containing protein, partial [Pseudonocardiaceae bacterium]
MRTTGDTAVETEHGARAAEALRLAESDPRRSVELARATVRDARAAGDREARSLAERAWGFAAFHLRDTDEALTHLRTAIRVGEAAGSARLAAEGRMALAGVLTWRGRPGAALREIGTALIALDGVRHARAVAQQGAILQLLGRLPQALERYRVALPVLRREDDRLWTHRVLLNRGVARAQRHELAAAAEDLRAAEALCAELDLGLALAQVHQNLGFVCTRRGDVPAAMAYLDRAERRFRELGSQLGPVLGDRAELLLSVRLIAEARQAAAGAVAALEREGRGV